MEEWLSSIGNWYTVVTIAGTICGIILGFILGFISGRNNG